MNIAVIPARGGSKRIPRKNVKQFHGKPMIAWSIEAALKSGCFDKVVVSTDDDEIARIAREYGALVPFIRPEELSNDHAGTIPVIANAIDELQKGGDSINLVCCIYATAPFVRSSDLLAGLEQIKSEQRDYVFSATRYAYPIQRALKLDKNRRVSMFDDSQFSTRSQDLEEAWHDAGQFYWGQAYCWLDHVPVFSSNASVVELPRYIVQDIDTKEDWVQAELLAKVLS